LINSCKCIAAAADTLPFWAHS